MYTFSGPDYVSYAMASSANLAPFIGFPFMAGDYFNIESRNYADYSKYKGNNASTRSRKPSYPLVSSSQKKYLNIIGEVYSKTVVDDSATTNSSSKRSYQHKGFGFLITPNYFMTSLDMIITDDAEQKTSSPRSSVELEVIVSNDSKIKWLDNDISKLKVSVNMSPDSKSVSMRVTGVFEYSERYNYAILQVKPARRSATISTLDLQKVKQLRDGKVMIPKSNARDRVCEELSIGVTSKGYRRFNRRVNLPRSGLLPIVNGKGDSIVGVAYCQQGERISRIHRLARFQTSPLLNELGLFNSNRSDSKPRVNNPTQGKHNSHESKHSQASSSSPSVTKARTIKQQLHAKLPKLSF